MTDNKRYTRTHEWICADGKHMTVGITAHAQELLGDLVYVELPAIGQHVVAGEELAVVESVKAAADVYAPVSGEVIAVNSALAEQAALINQSPEQDGWLIKLNVEDADALDALLNAEQYQQHITKTH